MSAVDTATGPGLEVVGSGIAATTTTERELRDLRADLDRYRYDLEELRVKLAPLLALAEQLGPILERIDLDDMAQLSPMQLLSAVMRG